MKRKLILVLTVVLTMSVLSGCSSGNKNTEKQSSDTTSVEGGKLTEITIPEYKVGQNVGAKFFVPQIERFNKKYEGKYKINLEEIPQDSYAEKIKQLAQQNKLPALIDGGDKDWFESYVIPNEKFYDLSEFIQNTSSIKDVIIEDALKFNTKNGKVVTLPLAVSRPMGLFYNKTMFNPQKPIKDMTMDEFLASLGDNKLALMTSENAWTSMLLYSSLVASQDGGKEVLINGVENQITDFNTPVWVKAAAKLQEIAQKHASSNSLGAAYADAANSFMSKNSAVIFNGSWMTNDFTPESADKWSNGFEGSQVGATIFPENVAFDNVQMYLWWIPSSASDSEREVALAFLEFMYSQEELEAFMLAEGGIAPNIKPSENFINLQKENALLYELNSSLNDTTSIIPTFEHVVPMSVSSQEFGKLLPKLYDGSFTAEKFCEELTIKAKESVQ